MTMNVITKDRVSMDENLGDLFRHTMGENHPGKEAANVESDSLLVAMGFGAVYLIFLSLRLLTMWKWGANVYKVMVSSSPLSKTK